MIEFKDVTKNYGKTVALRAALVWFFNMIIFHDIAVVQIAFCPVLGAALCALGIFPIRSKQV
jgi:hypothetical protein